MSRSPSGRRSAVGPLLACVLGGLLLTGGGTGSWVEIDATRELGGVVLPGTRSVPGTEAAPLAVLLGLVAMVVGVGFGVARGAVRRGLGLLAAGVGTAGLVTVAVGVVRASWGPGRLVGGPVIAALGALAVVGSGALALRSAARPSLPARYSIDQGPRGASDPDPDPDEWDLASGDDPA